MGTMEAMQYDPDFNGPIKNRGCTDILCLLLFIVFIIGWIAVAVIVFRYGDPDKLIMPRDKQGNVCGMGDFKDKKKLFFFDLLKCSSASVLIKGCPTEQVCVEDCPKQPFFPEHSAYYEKPLKNLPPEIPFICTYDTKRDNPETLRKLIADGKCASYYLPSDSLGSDIFRSEATKGFHAIIKSPFIGRCMPFLKNMSDIHEKKPDYLNQTNLLKGSKYLAMFLSASASGEMIYEDFKTSWPFILVGLAICMGFSLIWIILMRFIAGVMVWISIFAILGLLGFACYFSFNQFFLLNSDNKDYNWVANKNLDIQSEMPNVKFAKDTWLIFGIVIAVILLVLLLLLIFLRKRIVIAIALIKESSKAVIHIMSALFFPILTFVLLLGVVAFSVVVAAYIASAKIPEYRVHFPSNYISDEKCGKACNPILNNTVCLPKEFDKLCTGCSEVTCDFVKYADESLNKYAQAFNLFMFFWMMAFVIGFGQMVLAGAFATWYWAMDKRNIPTFVVTASFLRTLRYHTGSLAFGSLLIAIIKMIRVALEYIDRKVKEHTDNKCVKCILCCAKCCLWCLEKFIKFVNRNAFIMIAVYGKNFCTSARRAVSLIMRNAVRVVVLDQVTDFLLFIGKLNVVGGIGVLSFYIFNGEIQGIQKYLPALNYNLVPVIIIIIGSYIITSGFFSVYAMAVDTVFLCFLEDCERNDGTPEKPYRMSKKLMKILDKHNKLQDPQEG